MDDTLTQAEAARITGMTPGGIRQWILTGKLKSVRMGRIVLVNRHDVEEANELSLQDLRRKRWLKEEPVETI